MAESALKGYFQLGENGGKCPERIENTVGKGEIARYEQFLLFPLCFSIDLYCRQVKPGLVWERVKWEKVNKTEYFTLA